MAPIYQWSEDDIRPGVTARSLNGFRYTISLNLQHRDLGYRIQIDIERDAFAGDAEALVPLGPKTLSLAEAAQYLTDQQTILLDAPGRLSYYTTRNASGHFLNTCAVISATCLRDAYEQLDTVLVEQMLAPWKERPYLLTRLPADRGVTILFNGDY